MRKRPRATSEAPYCWQNKEALRLIRNELSESNLARRALAIYSALTEVASNQQAPVFKVSLRELAELSCYTRRSIENALKDLARLDLIAVEAVFSGHGYRDCNKYTLLSWERSTNTQVEEPPAVIASAPATVKERPVLVAPLIEEQREEHTKNKTNNLNHNSKELFMNKGLPRLQIKRGKYRGSPNNAIPDQSKDLRSLARSLIRKTPPSHQEVTNYLMQIGASKTEADSFYSHADTVAWTGPDGRAWNDWRRPANQFVAEKLLKKSLP